MQTNFLNKGYTILSVFTSTHARLGCGYFQDVLKWPFHEEEYKQYIWTEFRDCTLMSDDTSLRPLASTVARRATLHFCPVELCMVVALLSVN